MSAWSNRGYSVGDAGFRVVIPGPLHHDHVPVRRVMIPADQSHSSVLCPQPQEIGTGQPRRPCPLWIMSNGILYLGRWHAKSTTAQRGYF